MATFFLRFVFLSGNISFTALYVFPNLQLSKCHFKILQDNLRERESLRNFSF